MQPNTTFSIVVIGRMNPSIHHPVWYKTEGLIVEDEFNHAIGGGVVICTPEFSQFLFEATTVTCTGDNWRVATQSAPERALALATKVFEILHHTPVLRYGINFDIKFDAPEGALASIADVSALLPGSTCEIQTREPTPSGGCHWARLGQGSAGAYLLNNFDHAAPKVESFSLTPLFAAAYAEAQRLTDVSLRSARGRIFGEGPHA